MITCKSKEDYEILKALRSHGWSRGLINEKKISKANKHLDSRFIFYNSGFNLRPTDISAAIGISQFRDMEKLKKIRNKNRDLLVKSLQRSNKISKSLKFIHSNKNVFPSWFGIPILLKEKDIRKKFLNKLEKNGIETRPIISGNFLKQPSIKKYKLINNKKFSNSDIVNERGFFIGLPSKKLNNNFINQIVDIFEKSL